MVMNPEQISSPEVSPTESTPVSPTETVESTLPQGEKEFMGEGIPQEEIEAYFDSLPEPDKAFLAEHLTPEIIKVISIVSGPEVGQFLNQFADTSMVLVPVPREVAEQHMQAQQGQAAAMQQPQGVPQAPAPQPQATGSMMTPPSQQATATPTM